MSGRIKEEERIEKIIRGLLKQPENKRCINCNSLGPQYVCTTFWTFVCTNCSGVHREFTHRVKSVSMAKFNAEEVTSLQAGGNERARQIYFKTWDPQRNSYPDGSNLRTLREFVRHVFVDRKFSGGNSSDRLSMVESDRRRDSCEPHYSDISSWGGKDYNLERRSFERGGKSGGIDNYERRSFEKSYPVPRIDGKNFKNTEEGRSLRYVQENVRPGGQRSRSTQFEIVDDRFRDDGNVKRYDKSGNRESRGESGSPSSRESREIRFPEIRPVKDILGDNVPPLTIGELPKASATNNSTDGNRVQTENINVSSLIDFDDSPVPHGQLKNLNKSSEDTRSAAKVNTLESLLLEYSAPVTSLSGVETSSGAKEDLMSSSAATDDGSGNAPEISDTLETISALKVVTDQIFLSNCSDPTEQISEINQQQNSSPVSNDPITASRVSFDKPSQVDESGDGSKSNQRKELPADLFASDFTAFSPTVPGWQMCPPRVMQFRPPPVSMVAFPNALQPSNPFDIGSEKTQVQATMFPSMSSLEGAMPNMPCGNLLQPHPSPYATSFSPYPPANYPINLPKGAYLGQQPNNMSLSSERGILGFDDPFAAVNPIHQANREESLHAAPQTPRRGVNPFG